ncbi:5-methylcytosine restriction system specificity protein McrC [Pantoea allii]|uniref:5-methylcytosine restriction system specificity protein McrC n=1 Tax=Pantoea allii TaxID=574096 RepID=UPI003D323D4D
MNIELKEYGEPVFYPSNYINIEAIHSANKYWRRALKLAKDPIRAKEISNGILELRAEGVTGVIQVDNINIEVVPKFLSDTSGNWKAVLWKILTMVEGGYIDKGLTTANRLSVLSIPDLLAEIFYNSYFKGAARGLPRAYSTGIGAGNVLRGKLDYSRINEWTAKPWLLPYVTDSLCDDTSVSSLLRWTAECLATTVKAAGRARTMHEIASELSHVNKSPPNLIDAQKIYLGPLHRGLEEAVLIGILLLKGHGILHERGHYKLSGFLWNSDVIYENYIYMLCERAASSCGNRVNKALVKFGELIRGKGGKLETTPDVVFKNINGTPIAVTDAKYKNINGRPKSQDTYQILTAAHVLGCQRVSLIYPVAVNLEPTAWVVKSGLGGDHVELTMLPLNLMQLVIPGGQEKIINMIVYWLKGRFEK